MAFPVVKTLDLSYLGEGWGGTYLKLRALTFGESEKLATMNIDADNPDPQKTAAEVKKFVGDHFIEGKAWDGTKLVEVTADNFTELPQEVIMKAIETASGAPSPNSSVA